MVICKLSTNTTTAHVQRLILFSCPSHLGEPFKKGKGREGGDGRGVSLLRHRYRNAKDLQNPKRQDDYHPDLWPRLQPQLADLGQRRKEDHQVQAKVTRGHSIFELRAVHRTGAADPLVPECGQWKALHDANGSLQAGS